MSNRDFMDALALMSYAIGMANYEENLTQSDKDEIMQKLDEKTNGILEQLEADLSEQNEMLQEILESLKGGK